MALSLSPHNSINSAPFVESRPTFVESHKDYHCPVCKQVLHNALQTECGHLVCEECLLGLLELNGLNGSVACPELQNDCVSLKYSPECPDKSNVRIDQRVNRQIRSFKVHCTNDNCQETMPWKELEEHKSKCGKKIDCKYKEAGCEEHLSAGDMSVHTMLCTYRPTVCIYCKKTVVHRNITRHHGECNEFPVCCPNNCQDSTMTRERFRQHTKECPQNNILENCMYETLGCKFRGTHKEVNTHMQSSTASHLELITISVATLDAERAEMHNKLHEVKCQSENVEYCVTESKKSSSRIETTLSKLEKLVVSNSRRIKALEDRCEQFGEQLSSIHDSLANLPAERNAAMNGAEELNNGALASMTRYEQQLAQLNVQLADIDVRLGSASLAGLGLDVRPWRISRFAQLRAQADAGNERSFNSPSFYTQLGPYHVRLRLYPAGDGQGTGTHLSLYLQIMHGDYDSILEWPFKHRVKFELLDQLYGADHIRDIFLPDPASTSFQRPDQNEENIASGAPTFAPLEQLDRANSKYLVDDTIFIRFTLMLAH